MIVRTLSVISALYACGHESLDGIRPEIFEGPSKALHELLAPASAYAEQALKPYAEKYLIDMVAAQLPDNVRYGRKEHPMETVGFKLGKL